MIGEGPSVYVETDEGRLFVLHIGSYQEEWREAEGTDASRNGYGDCALAEAVSYQSGELAGVVVEELICSYWPAPDAGGITDRYAILDNGEVWRWRRFGRNLNELWRHYKYASSYACGGELVGLLWGIGLGSITYLARKRQHRDFPYLGLEAQEPPFRPHMGGRVNAC